MTPTNDMSWTAQHLAEQGYRVDLMDRGIISQELAELLDDTENDLRRMQLREFLWVHLD